jgi:hypothetical protein
VAHLVAAGELVRDGREVEAARGGAYNDDDVTDEFYWAAVSACAAKALS